MNQQESIQKLAEMIEGIEIAMLATVDSEGHLRSRPMVTQRVTFDGELWFFTNSEAPKVEEIQKNQQLCLSYSDPDRNRYISVTGTGELVRDRNKMRELWHPMLKAWFPKGLDDENISLLKVSVEAAEYWEFSSRRMVQIAGLVRALATGKPLRSPGEHEKLKLSAS